MRLIEFTAISYDFKQSKIRLNPMAVTYLAAHPDHAAQTLVHLAGGNHVTVKRDMDSVCKTIDKVMGN